MITNDHRYKYKGSLWELSLPHTKRNILRQSKFNYLNLKTIISSL